MISLYYITWFLKLFLNSLIDMRLLLKYVVLSLMVSVSGVELFPGCDLCQQLCLVLQPGPVIIIVRTVLRQEILACIAV